MNNEAVKKQRLLIVDDSKVIRVTARKILQDHFDTVEAVDGENAWEHLNNTEPFSLVVSDLTMPKLDGFGLLERIRSSHLPHIRDIPVIIITGSNDSESTKARATQAGATDFIGKPFDSVHLLARTQAHAVAHTAKQTLTKENLGLESQSLTDPLTGLPNEAAFMDHSYQQLSYAVRHKTSLAVFRIEIDDFGDLFKSHGKGITESIIKSVATVLQSSIRHEDLAARVGTARFAMLLPGMNAAGIRNLADRINRSISARILKHGEHKIRYTVSIGVAAPEIRRDARFDELLSTADSRLVCAIAQGGNQVVFEDPGQVQRTPDKSLSNEDTRAVLPDEPVNATFNHCVETETECEEISLESIEPVVQVEEITLDEIAAVESLLRHDADDLPSMFAGPVPESGSSTAHNNTQADSSRSAFSGQINSPFDHNADDEETILITAPYGIFNPADEIQTTGLKEKGTVHADCTHDKDSSTEEQKTLSSNCNPSVDEASDMNQTDAMDETVTIKRAGIFRRALAFLFRRSTSPA
ncbi:MAG: diguanylate cyclase [Gammaproteobacteria bacterium]|jgi:diguanylate cyclase (GGDEF)-like protein|nr:diguanylate cyclase [Gammaproteobacteria bacterium]